MKIGFTGTQDGLKLAQLDTLYELVDQIGATEAHHGDCIGGDAIFHEICVEVGIPVVIHPPEKSNKRQFCEGGTILPSKPYLERNHDIVDEVEVMFVCPKTEEEQRRSGTWATWRYAMKQCKRIFLIYPSGEVAELHDA